MGEIYFGLLLNALLFALYLYGKKQERDFNKHWETTIKE